MFYLPDLKGKNAFFFFFFLFQGHGELQDTIRTTKYLFKD